MANGQIRPEQLLLPDWYTLPAICPLYPQQMHLGPPSEQMALPWPQVKPAQVPLKLKA